MKSFEPHIPIICFTICFVASCWAAVTVSNNASNFSSMTTVMGLIITGGAGFVSGKALSQPQTKIDKTDSVQVTNENGNTNKLG